MILDFATLGLNGASHVFLVKSVLRFGAMSDFGVPRVAVVACTIQHGLVPGRLPKTRERRAPTLCPASDAASKTYVDPTSFNGGLAAPQPPDQKTRDAPSRFSEPCPRCRNDICLT